MRFSISTDPRIQRAIKASAEAAGLDPSWPSAGGLLPKNPPDAVDALVVVTAALHGPA
jgi:hypothetical protein